MKYIVIISIFSILYLVLPNCNVYKWEKNEPCYEACQLAEKAIQYHQGSAKSQFYFNKSIDVCPEFAYSYMEKAVPFLKRGDFITWKELIDKAVGLEPEEYLGYRGWCRYQFLRDYEGAIKDIERLEKIVDYDIGVSQNGDYHLRIAKALAYKGLNNKKRAIQIIQNQLKTQDYDVGLYDYFHLGVLQLELNNIESAKISFEKQIEVNDYLAETYYYLALISKTRNDKKESIAYLNKAKLYYEKGKKFSDPYTEQMDAIYYSDIIGELNKITNNPSN